MKERTTLWCLPPRKLAWKGIPDSWQRRSCGAGAPSLSKVLKALPDKPGGKPGRVGCSGD